MVLRRLFILSCIYFTIKAQESEEKETPTTTTTFTTTTTEIPGTTKNPCPGKNSSECVKNMISLMSDNLAINRPLNLSQPYCRDFWGRAGISQDGICIYIQIVRMNQDKNGTLQSKQYLNSNQYSHDAFWHRLEKDYISNDISLFKKTVNECFDLKEPDVILKFAVWHIGSNIDEILTIDLMLAHCCLSEKANGCFKDPQNTDEILVFPQCFNEVTEVKFPTVWKVLIYRAQGPSKFPLNRVKTCNYHEYLGASPDENWIGFENPGCYALDLRRTCYMGLQPKENGDGFYQLLCCQKYALNTTEFPNGKAHGSVYSPLAEMLLYMKSVHDDMGERKLCVGGIDVKQKLCFFNFNLVDFPKPVYIEPDFEDSVLISNEDSYNCSIVWTKNTAIVPVVRCICSYGVKKMCDKEVLKDFKTFSQKIEGHMMKTHCDQPPSEIARSIVVGCQIVMDIKDNYIAVHPGPVQGNYGRALFDSNIETNKCEQSKDNETFICYCRANYTGNNFCNTIENFPEQYQELVTILQTRSNFKNPVTLYHTDCLKNFKKLSVDLKSKFIDTTFRILCYSSNYGPQKEKDTEYYDQNEEKGSEETGVYLPGQVNENIKIIPRIACDMFFDETLDSNIVDGCKCLISTSDILKKKPLYCCCQPNKIQ